MLRGFHGTTVRDEIAARIGLAPHEVREHPDGHVVTVAGGGQLLVSGTVVRRYVPEVDDAEPARATEPDTAAAAVKAAPKGAPRRSGGRAH
jgi:hypothetical protein